MFESLEWIGGYLPVLVVVALAAVTVFKGAKQVPQGEEWTVERFGKYIRTLRPGLSIIIPYVDSVGMKVNMRERVLDVDSQKVITSDNAAVTVDGVTFYQVVDPVKASYQVNDAERAIMNLVTTNIRTVLGSMNLDDALSKRDSINARLLKIVDDATEPWGIKVTRIEIKDVSPPDELLEAMAKQMKSEREKRAMILESEGRKQSAILIADGEREAAVLNAEGERQAAFKQAEARERLAEADAKATRDVSEAIAQGDIKAVNFFIAQEYTKALTAIGSAQNNKVVMIPLEASSLIGSLSGILSVAKGALSEDQERHHGGRE
ncbi:MAG: SPFH/Band 7/PHB domain protein [Gammaproteobacteria bacterium]|nr:SPFH/Band 7/PHB domain protein [Gammaproteobacteria bacterium]